MNKFPDRGDEFVDARIQRGIFFSPLFAFCFDLPRMLLDQLGLLLERIFLEDLGCKQLLQVMAEAFVVINNKFERPFNTVESCVAVSFPSAMR